MCRLFYPVGALRGSILRRFMILFLVTLVVVALPGCADLVEVDDLNIVLGIGVDQVDNSTVHVTAEIVRLEQANKSSKSATGNQQDDSVIIGQDGRTIEEAIHNLEYKIPRRTYLPNNTVFVFGDAYAKRGIYRAMDFLDRSRHLRRNQILAVTSGTAAQLFEVGVSPINYHADAIRKLVEESAREKHSIDSEQLRFIRLMLQPSGTAEMARVEVDRVKNELTCTGVGLFSDGRLTQYLDQRDTRSLAILQGQGRAAPITIPCKDATQADIGMTLRVLQSDTRITPSYYGNRMHFRVKVRGIVEFVRLCPNQKIDLQNVKRLEATINQHVTFELQSLVSRLQNQNVDAVHFGDLIYRTNPSFWHRIQPQWQSSIYKSAIVTYDVKFHVIRYGLSTDSPFSTYRPNTSTPLDGYKEKL